jgi:DNA recombination protein RmuC
MVEQLPHLAPRAEFAQHRPGHDIDQALCRRHCQPVTYSLHAQCVGGGARMTLALVVLGVVAIALLVFALYLLLRANPLQAELEQLRARLQQLTEERARLGAELQHAAGRFDEQKLWVREQTQHFEARVLAATAKLVEESGRALSERNQKDMGAVVTPFKEQLAEFRQRVDHIYAADTHERGSLKAQIEQLTSLNQAMSVQAQQLTNALTVSSRSTGDWGETILERILEESGLQRGREYDLQVVVTGRNNETLRPDAVINLPESRHLVVDSKVSNKAWTEYCAAADDTDKAAKLRLHLASLRAHIKDLSGKGYTDSPELTTVDFVLMFVPVEAALLTAFAKDPDLYGEAHRARIVLVTPSTLMAVIKLVQSIWTVQKRKESADELFEVGRKLYEKMTNFAETFEKVGDAIKASGDAYEKAFGQLKTGRGSAIRLAENMKQLGVTPASGKQMPAVLLIPDRDEDE